VERLESYCPQETRGGQIRIATPDDAHDLAVMHIASWHETYLGLLPDKVLAALSSRELIYGP
jgi:hypothetical protein